MQHAGRVADPGRREVLKWGGALAAFVSSGHCGAGLADDRRDSGGSQALAAASGGAGEADPRVAVTVPREVEDGFNVPVTVESRIPDTREILILVDHNPIPFAVRFAFPEGTDPYVSTRIKMSGSGVVKAAVNAGGRLYTGFAETKITVGGCS